MTLLGDPSSEGRVIERLAIFLRGGEVIKLFYDVRSCQIAPH